MKQELSTVFNIAGLNLIQLPSTPNSGLYKFAEVSDRESIHLFEIEEIPSHYLPLLSKPPITVHTEQEQEGFTMGEWIGGISGIQESPNSWITVSVEDKTGKRVALVYGDSFKEAEANAALIAEAKNMYAFIKEMATRYANSEWIAGEANKIINRIKQ